MLFDENIECWRAGNNLPSSDNLCSMVGKGTKLRLRWAEVGIAPLYLAHVYEWEWGEM